MFGLDSFCLSAHDTGGSKVLLRTFPTGGSPPGLASATGPGRNRDRHTSSSISNTQARQCRAVGRLALLLHCASLLRECPANGQHHNRTTYTRSRPLLASRMPSQTHKVTSILHHAEGFTPVQTLRKVAPKKIPPHSHAKRYSCSAQQTKRPQIKLLLALPRMSSKTILKAFYRLLISWRTSATALVCTD